MEKRARGEFLLPFILEIISILGVLAFSIWGSFRGYNFLFFVPVIFYEAGECFLLLFHFFAGRLHQGNDSASYRDMAIAGICLFGLTFLVSALFLLNGFLVPSLPFSSAYLILPFGFEFMTHLASALCLRGREKKQPTVYLHARRLDEKSLLPFAFYLLYVAIIMPFRNEGNAAWFFLSTILLDFFVTSVSAYYVYAALLEGKRKEYLNLKGAIKATEEEARDHDLGFYIGTSGTLLLGLAGFFSSNQQESRLLGAFYLCVAGVKVSAFIWQKKLQASTMKDPIHRYRKQYAILLYTAIWGFVLSSSFGSLFSSIFQARTEGTTPSYWYLALTAIFVLLRFILGTIRAKKMRSHGDPYRTSFQLLDYLVILVALFSTIVIIANIYGTTENKWFVPVITWAGLSLYALATIQCFFSFFLAISGLRGKRDSCFIASKEAEKKNEPSKESPLSETNKNKQDGD